MDLASKVIVNCGLFKTTEKYYWLGWENIKLQHERYNLALTRKFSVCKIPSFELHSGKHCTTHWHKSVCKCTSLGKSDTNMEENKLTIDGNHEKAHRTIY